MSRLPLYIAACKQSPHHGTKKLWRDKNWNFHDFRKSIQLSNSHPAHIFVPLEDVTYIPDLTWSRATLHHMRYSRISTGVLRVEASKLNVESVKGSKSVNCFEKLLFWIQVEGFTILNKCAYFEIDSGDILEPFVAKSMPRRSFPGLLATAQKSFAARDLTLCSSIINIASRAVVEVDSAKGSVRFVCTETLLMSFSE